MDLRSIANVLMLLCGVLFFTSMYVSRHRARPTFDVSKWKPIWKQRDDHTPVGFVLVCASLVCLVVSGVLRLLAGPR